MSHHISDNGIGYTVAPRVNNETAKPEESVIFYSDHGNIVITKSDLEVMLARITLKAPLDGDV